MATEPDRRATPIGMCSPMCDRWGRDQRDWTEMQRRFHNSEFPFGRTSSPRSLCSMRFMLFMSGRGKEEGDVGILGCVRARIPKDKYHPDYEPLWSVVDRNERGLLHDEKQRCFLPPLSLSRALSFSRVASFFLHRVSLWCGRGGTW